MSSEQPKSNQTILNLYGAYNQELQRMHDLVKICIQSPTEQHYQQHNPMSRGYGYPPPSQDAHAFWQRIIEMQNILIAALQSHDPIIQEKVAELALTGTANVEIKSSDEIPF